MNYDYVNELLKPDWQPAPIVFKIVWPILYILMFLSLYIFLSAGTEVNNYLNNYKLKGVIIFTLQLLLNLVWSPIFFYYKKIFLAFVVAVMLSVVTGWMVFHFYGMSKTAGIMNIPYLLWLIFAVILNFKIYLLNRN